MGDWFKDKLFLKPQPPRPPIVSPIPPLLALPANAPTRAVQMLIVDPDYPVDHALRMQAMAAAIASHAGVRLAFPPIAKYERAAWINFVEEMIPSVRNYAAAHENHPVLLVKTIFLSRPTDTRFVGGLGSSKFSVLAAVSCTTSLFHEIAHAAGLPHRDTDSNVMHGRVCGDSMTKFDADQAETFRNWATTKTVASRTADALYVCGG